jgi:hypothetical protein
MRNRSRTDPVRWLAPVAAVAILLQGCSAGPGPESYADDPGGFRILLVGKPEHSTRTLSSPAGPLSLTSTESVDRDQVRRIVAYTDLPRPLLESTDPSTLLDGGIRGMSGEGRWTIQGQGPVTLDGHPGRDVRFAIDSPSAPEKGAGRARIVLAGGRLYQAIVIGPASRVSEKDLDAFVQSFELLRTVPAIAGTASPPPGGPPVVVQAEAPAPASPASSTPASTPPASSAPPPAEELVGKADAPGPDPSRPAEVALEANQPAGSVIERPAPDGNPQERFREAAPPRGVLVGVRVGYIDAFGGSKVGAVQPIFQAGDAYIDGRRFGKEIPLPVTVVAHPGYAVGAINTRTGLLLDAFQVIFMRFKEGRLDPTDFYTSEWLGDPRGGGPGTATGEGRFVVGIHGRSDGREINALGLLIAE